VTVFLFCSGYLERSACNDVTIRKSVVLSFRKRLAACIKAEGGYLEHSINQKLFLVPIIFHHLAKLLKRTAFCFSVLEIYAKLDMPSC